MVTAFFNSVDTLEDDILYAFIENLKGDMEIVMGILHSTTNEMIVFFTYLMVLLKRLDPDSQSFKNSVRMIRNLVKEINDEGSTPAMFANDFNKFFNGHLLRNYCTVINESPIKREYICQLIYTHCAHDL